MSFERHIFFRIGFQVGLEPSFIILQPKKMLSFLVLDKYLGGMVVIE